MDVEQQIADLNSQVARFYNQGTYERAFELSQQSYELSMRALGENHPLTLSSVNNAAALFKATHDYEKAEQLYLKALEIVENLYGEGHAESVLFLHNLARCYRATGRYREMEPVLCRALDIAHQFPLEVNPDHVVQCLNTLADMEAVLGRYVEAEKHLEDAMNLAVEVFGEGSIAYAQTLQNLSNLYIELNRDIDTEPLLQKVLAVIGSGSDGEQNIYFARTLHTLAEVRNRLGKRTDAHALLEKALAIKRDLLGEDDPDVARTLNSLAGLAAEQGRYSAAEPLYNRAIQIIEKTHGPQAPDLPPALQRLAALFHDMGDLAGAELHLTRAIGIEKALGRENTLDLAHHLNSLALVYIDQGKFDLAEALQLESLKIRRQVLGDSSSAFGLMLNNMAGLYREMGDWPKAENYLRQAVGIQRSAPNQPPLELAHSLANLALVLQESGRYAEAEPLHREVLAIRTDHFGEVHPSVSHALNNLALLYAATGREREALEQKSRVEAIDDHLIGEVFSTGSERQRMLYLEDFIGPFYSFLTLVSDIFANSPEAVGNALNLVQKRKSLGAEVLGVQRDAVLVGKYPVLQSQLDRVHALRTQMANKTLEGPGPEGIEAHRALISKWRDEKEKLEKDLAQHIPEMKLEQELQTADRSAIANALQTGAVLVEFVRIHAFNFKALPAKGQAQWTRMRYLAFVLHAGRPDEIALVDLGDAEKIDRLIADFRSTITGGDRHLFAAEPAQQASTGGTDLRAALFDPLIPVLRGCSRLFIAPDGDLTRLPFEALPTGNGRCLIDNYRISYLTVGRDLLRHAAVPSTQIEKPVVVAFPDFDLAVAGPESDYGGLLVRQSLELSRGGIRFNPLPGTLLEAQRIADMLGVQPFVGAEALESLLKASQSPRILHIATHGFFLNDQLFDSVNLPSMAGAPAENPLGRLSIVKENPLLRSGLALAGANTWLRRGPLPLEAEDGILTAEDVSGLNLVNTELVVLSACETGLGEIRLGEGVFGLRRSFVLAGAKTLVMSLWKVPDRQTQELMEDFYRRILAGQARSDALREAQLAMKEKYPDPLYWGAFICQGDPEPLTSCNPIS